MRRPRNWCWLGLRPLYLNETETDALLAALRRWFKTADPWLERNPDQAAALEAWEVEHVTGDGTYGTGDWPGWAASPMGPMPSAKDFIGTARRGGRRR